MGLDIKLVAGDLALGHDGDLLCHTDEALSFADVLKYKSQVAANLKYEAGNFKTTIKRAMDAISSDPRVASAKINSQNFYGEDVSGTAIPNPKFVVVDVTITLRDGRVLENLVVPLAIGASDG